MSCIVDGCKNPAEYIVRRMGTYTRLLLCRKCLLEFARQEVAEIGAPESDRDDH